MRKTDILPPLQQLCQTFRPGFSGCKEHLLLLGSNRLLETTLDKYLNDYPRSFLIDWFLFRSFFLLRKIKSFPSFKKA
jgi:hypothetical protein